MHFNLVVLSGRLAAPVEYRSFASGSRLARLLVTIRSTEPRRRVDVLPVTIWDPADDVFDPEPQPGSGVWIAGMVQRRFWQDGEGRRSRLELVANHVELRDGENEGVGPCNGPGAGTGH